MARADEREMDVLWEAAQRAPNPGEVWLVEIQGSQPFAGLIRSFAVDNSNKSPEEIFARTPLVPAHKLVSPLHKPEGLIFVQMRSLKRKLSPLEALALQGLRTP